ncbi:MAG: hypothetical protein JW927_18670 [Deltaproteobacteria bacterium]|nr:hypothetical protein [Deltaproteobacteria bacterium]
MNKKHSLCYVFCGILIGIPLGIIITNSCSVNSPFLDVKLIEIIQLILTFIIAVFITYIINSVVNRESKKVEQIYMLIDNFHSKIIEISTIGISYMNNPDDEKATNILSLIKTAGNLLSTIYGLKKHVVVKKLLDSNDLHRDYIKLKYLLTGPPFKEIDQYYSFQQKEKFERQYMLLSNKLYDYKINMYS